MRGRTAGAVLVGGHTVTDREELERELADVRRTGFALCDREYEEFSSGSSAAVLNSGRAPIAVVNVWGPAAMNSARRLREIGRGERRSLAAQARRDDLYLAGYGGQLLDDRLRHGG